jgi:V/A-type H+-transporting ATPase subunit I
MIVPMKKATILFRTTDSERTVARLRSLGALQVEHLNVPESRDISALQEKLAAVDAALDLMDRMMVPDTERPSPKRISGDGIDVSNHILELGRRMEQLEASSVLIRDQIHTWERWGDIDRSQVQELNQHGVFLKLYEVPVKEVGNVPPGVVIKTLFTYGETAHCVAISRRPIDCAFPEVLPPRKRLSLLKQQLAEQTDEREAVKGEILDHMGVYQDLLEKKRGLGKEIEFQQVLSGMGREGAISYITGYIPTDREEHLAAEAKERKWGILISEPSADETVPTLLRNPRWADMIAPVLDFLGLTPGYRELDVSIPFLIFFSIFFGILIGDAGYGLAYILITLLLALWLQRNRRLDSKTKTIVSLFVVLGSSAIVWGVLTGTFFGQTWLVDLGFRPPAPQLNDPIFIQSFCFFLGALHLSIAHSWRAILKFPSLKALADVGYICILWTAFFLANTLILGVAFPSWGLWLVGTGVILVIVFTSPQVQVFRGIAEGIGTILMSLMNNLTDVISYVRLFAVGLATLAIAETANTMASDVSGFSTGIIAFLAGAVVLIVGHGLNLLLGPISVLVHGVRLNVLEFSGHANVTWSGMVFNPLKE